MTEQQMTQADLREAIAAVMHQHWVAWTHYMLKHMAERPVWEQRQRMTYADLPETVKHINRGWADAVLGDC